MLDGLTFVWNREGIERLLLRALLRQREESVAVLMVDIDRFKQINDTLGHAAGDEVLREVAARLTRAVRDQDSVGRYGGEEFVVCLSGAQTGPQASQIAERVRGQVSDTPVRTRGGEVSVTVSVGMAIGNPAQGHTAEALVEMADQAMYEAKRAGRDRVVVAGGLAADPEREAA
ncbi:MAG: GGDEF domain-containing protein [Phycisphaerales bacterium]|nr:GGDEF domain-containing protein [Phycisphaerales bacterium]